MKEKKQLKYGIICDSLFLEEWHYEMLEKLEETPGVECCLVIEIKSKGTFLLKKRKKWNVKQLLPHAHYETYTLQALFGKEDLSTIESYNGDFFLSLSNVCLGGKILEIAPHGVWSFRHSQERYPFLQEMLRGDSFTEVFLDRLVDKNRVLNLKSGCLPTIQFSPKLHKQQIEHIIKSWPAQICEKILFDIPYHSVSPMNPVSQRPMITPAERTRSIVRIVNQKVKRWYKRLFGYEYWSVGIVNKPLYQMIDEDYLEIEWLFQDENLYYADPFAYEVDGELRLIFEEVDYRTVKGFISEFHIKKKAGEKQENTLKQAIMSQPTHMSYPFIVKDGEDYYCIPETSEAKEVGVYKWEQESHQWKKVKTIIEGFAAVDSTVVKVKNKWWLFCTRGSSYQTENHELHIYHADTLLGEWKPHLLNPVKHDVRSSRPAGTPFIYNDTLYRPAQNCSITYGGSISLNKVTVLNTREFDEETVTCMKQQPGSLYPDGVHTLSYAGKGFSLVDGKRIDYHPLNLFKKLYLFNPKPLRKVVKEVNTLDIVVKRKHSVN